MSEKQVQAQPALKASGANKASEHKREKLTRRRKGGRRKEERKEEKRRRE